MTEHLLQKIDENLLHKVEDKVMTLITEVEGLRKEVQRLGQENLSLKNEKEVYTNKLQYLLLLIEDGVENNNLFNATMTAVKPVLVQG